MSLDLNDLESRLKAALPDADATVTTDGYYYTARVVSDQFEGLRPVKRQQLVYGAFNDLIASGALHALNIEAVAPSELET